MFLLKRQMSKTRFQEYKKKQIEKDIETLKNETIDTFLSPAHTKKSN